MQRCPSCYQPLSDNSINIREGVAHCTSCGELIRLSEVILSDKSSEEILEKPPSGCTVENIANQVVVHVSARNLGHFLAATAICVFWNSILSIFLLHAIAGVYFNLVGPLPDWFPSPGMKEGVPEINGGPMGPGETIFLCLFLVPFVLIGVSMFLAALMNLFGSVLVVMDRHQSYVSTGVGFLRWWSNFDPRDVDEVKITIPRWNNEDGTKRNIKIVGSKSVQLGSYLSEQKIEWLCMLLSMLLLDKPYPSEEIRMLRPSWMEG